MWIIRAHTSLNRLTQKGWKQTTSIPLDTRVGNILSRNGSAVCGVVLVKPCTCLNNFSITLETFGGTPHRAGNKGRDPGVKSVTWEAKRAHSPLRCCLPKEGKDYEHINYYRLGGDPSWELGPSAAHHILLTQPDLWPRSSPLGTRLWPTLSVCLSDVQGRK